jgi:hypothetical protein
MNVLGTGNVSRKFYGKWIELEIDGIAVRVDYDDVNHAEARNLANEIVKRLKEAPSYDGPQDEE